MNQKKINIDSLNRDLYLLATEEPEILNELLQDNGYNPQSLEKNGVAKVKSLLFQQTVALKKIQHEDLYSRAIEIFESAKANTREAILSLLRQRAPQLQFNKFEKMEEEDLKDILDETDLLELMSKIEKGEL